MSTLVRPQVKRTYGSSGSRSSRHPRVPSSPVSDLRSSSPPPTPARAHRPTRDAFKRPLGTSGIENSPGRAFKRPRLDGDDDFLVKSSPKSISSKSSSKFSKSKSTKPKLTQLQLVPDQPLLKTCSLCSLSYIKGAADDEILHRTHCSRVRRGMEWGKEEERQLLSVGKEVASRIRLKDGSLGRIVCFKADASGKLGSKLATLLETINLNLSAPALTTDILVKSKAYLFLAPLAPAKPSTPSSSSREKIVACVIAQQIETAMRIASPDEVSRACIEPIETQKPITEPSPSPTQTLLTVDSPNSHSGEKGIFAHPKPLPTPLGISRIFVASSHRRQGIASALLNSIMKTFIHGYILDPRRGEVAFTQPTGDGGALMRSWGGSSVRVYDECA